jgi:heme exporter protein D
MGGFEVMIWAGAAVTLIGVAGLFACVVYALRLRRSGLAEAALRAALQKGVLWNTAALFVSVIGLMLVILGIALR